MNRPPADRGRAAVAEAAERAQAEYFRCLLAERRAEIDLAIVKLPGEARDRSPMIRSAEREGQEIDWMIAALDRRFPPAGHEIGRSLLSISPGHQKVS